MKLSEVIDTRKGTWSSRHAWKMLIRIGKIILAIALGCSFSFSLWKLIICLHERHFTDLEAVDNWLEENRLESLKKVFRDHGEFVCLLCNGEFHTVLWFTLGGGGW